MLEFTFHYLVPSFLSVSYICPSIESPVPTFTGTSIVFNSFVISLFFVHFSMDLLNSSIIYCILVTVSSISSFEFFTVIRIVETL